jgi:hypothetical protein
LVIASRTQDVPAAADWPEGGRSFFEGIESYATEFHPCEMPAFGADALDESSIQDGYQMNLVAVCAIFTSFYIGLSLLPLHAALLPVAAVLLVVGPLAAIVMGRYLREKKKGDQKD